MTILEELTLWQTITAIATVGVAVIAIVLTIYQLIRTREDNRVKVRPHLVFLRQVLATGRVKILMQNIGLGPATFTLTEIILDGRVLPAEDPVRWDRILDSMKFRSTDITASTLSPGYGLAAGDSIEVVGMLVGLVADGDAFRINRELRRINMKVHFADAYGKTILPPAELNSDPA